MISSSGPYTIKVSPNLEMKGTSVDGEGSMSITDSSCLSKLRKTTKVLGTAKDDNQCYRSL